MSVAIPIESLEHRRLLAAQPTALFLGGTLFVTATDAADTVSFGFRGPRLIPIVNGAGVGKFSMGAVQRIEIQTLEGNDVVDLSNLSIPTYVNAGLGNDLVTGGKGNDSLTGAGGKDTLRGNDGVDRLSGGNTSDLLYGEGGNDVIYGGLGDDFADGGSGKDHFFGEDGNDTFLGGSGNDAAYGGGGTDKIYGQLGDDILAGDGGNDRLYGGDGNDILYGGKGADVIMGELGDDNIDSADGSPDRLIDGGEGNDTVLGDPTGETPHNAETVTSPAPPPQPPPAPVGGDWAKGVSFGDEAILDEHFDALADDLKTMGVKVVRLWFQVTTLNERPNAWDHVSEADQVKAWKGVTDDQRPVIAGLTMKRAFELQSRGFKVILTVSIHDAQPPATPQAVTDFFQFLMDSHRYADGTGKTLKDVVDAWEVNQEVDLVWNWAPSGVDKTEGIKQYVNQELIPAAAALHAGPVDQWEKIISGSVSYKPDDLRTLLTEAQAQNALNAIDYAGYHPYGRYLPDQSIDEVKGRVNGAVAIAKEFDKPLAATEWNVRGYPTDGSQDAAWAAAIDTVYRTYVAPNFGMAIYYTVVNDFAARGGSTSARPAGLFKHDTTLVITTHSTFDEQLPYYQSPLIKSDIFYDVFAILMGTPA